MKKSTIILLVTIFGFSINLSAQGDLLITPKRVVFEGDRQNKEMLNLANLGSDTAVYSISFVQYRMNEDGSFTVIEEEDSLHMFSEPYLRIFPRTVTLAPREPQVIALQYRKKPDMRPGEYCSRLFFRSEKKIVPRGSEPISDTTKIRIQLTPIFGLSIPIIIRVGEVNVSSTLSDLKIQVEQDRNLYLKLTINRTGNISVFGNISVEFVPEEGKPYEIGRVNGIGVYTDITRREAIIKLNIAPDTPLNNGKLKIKYTTNDPPNKEIYAEAELELF